MKNLKGKVTMELSEYNKLIETVMAYENAIDITQSYGESVRVNFNLPAFKREILAKLEEFYPNAILNENAFETWNNASTAIAQIKFEEEDENEINS